MKTSAITLLLLLAATFAFAAQPQPADVLGLRWGMSAEEVNAVRPLTQDTPGSEYYSAGTIKIAEREYGVILTIKPTTGLEEVMLSSTGASVEVFMDVFNLLEARYKRPNETSSDDKYGDRRSARWELPRTKITILFSDPVLFITYTARPGYDVIDQL